MMTSSSVDGMINLVQKLRQEKAFCEEAISQTKHKARILERRVEEVARQVGIAITSKEEKQAMMAVLKGRVEAKQKMFDQVKQREDMTQATVKDCMERVKGEAKERFAFVEEFEEEMMKLSDKMSKHSLVCTVSRLKKTADRMEEDEKVVDRRLADVQGVGGIMEENSAVGQIIGWKEMKSQCGQTVNEVAGMGEVARGKVEQLKEDISLLVERRNTILMSNN